MTTPTDASRGPTLADRIEAVPVKEDWTSQLVDRPRDYDYVQLSVSVADRDLIVAALRAPRLVAETGEPHSRVVSLKFLTALLALLPPRPVEVEGQRYEYQDPNAAERLNELRGVFDAMLAASPLYAPPAAPGDAVGATDLLLAEAGILLERCRLRVEYLTLIAAERHAKTSEDLVDEVKAVVSKITAAINAPTGPSPSPVEREAAFMLALVEHSIPADVQVMLTQGSKAHGIPPGVLRKALAAALAAQPAQAGETEHHKNGVRRGIKMVIEKLHERANEMNDQHAKDVLNAAAFNIGTELKTPELAKDRGTK